VKWIAKQTRSHVPEIYRENSCLQSVAPIVKFDQNASYYALSLQTISAHVQSIYTFAAMLCNSTRYVQQGNQQIAADGGLSPHSADGMLSTSSLSARQLSACSSAYLTRS
jgi:hypothetical protein